ncbi:MAG: 5'/3'-nucleotidase SurE [Kiloniellales bacterium]|nr:5'/3'-nucleotidase SurE [Kiloniellales bacterium]
MSDKVFDPTGARILVTNDDGVLAPGIEVLERIARAFSDDVWIVAPESEQSAASHSLTLRRPLQIRQLTERKFSVNGTPTDSVLVAQKKILVDGPAEIVLSGVNRGANLGEDVSYSGTVAAALEGASLGLPAIAFSQVYEPGESIHWATAEHYGVEVLKRLSGFAWPRGTLLNVNFPPCPAGEVSGIRAGAQGFREADVELVDYQSPHGHPFVWIGDFSSNKSQTDGSDLSIVDEGAVSVTPLHLDMTHQPLLQQLRESFQ